jgi:quinol-cytochrome oxidoreductase complex cytochrome b subunit
VRILRVGILLSWGLTHNYHCNIVLSRSHTAGRNVIFLRLLLLLPLASGGSLFISIISLVLVGLRATDARCELVFILGSTTLNLFMLIIGLGSESLFFLSLISCYAILILNSALTGSLTSLGAGSGISFAVLSLVGLGLSKYILNIGISDHTSFLRLVVLMLIFLARHMRDHAGCDIYVNTNILVARRIMFTSIHATHVFICWIFAAVYLVSAHLLGDNLTLWFVVRYFHLVEALWNLISTVVLTSISAIAYNHVVEYFVPAAINFAWGFGFVLTMLLLTRIFTGYCLVSSSLHSRGVAGLLGETKTASFGWMRWRLQSIGSSAIRGRIAVHSRRAVLYGSATFSSNYSVWGYGVLIYTLAIVSCFLGYSSCYGLRAHWALRVVRGLVAWIPGLDIWFYGNYTPHYFDISKTLIFHVLVALRDTLRVFIHLILLHVTGSTYLSNHTTTTIGSGSSSSSRNHTTIYLFMTVVLKDILAYAGARICFAKFAIGYASVINCDNSRIVDLDNLTMISHIVPEWYLLSIYRLIKLVPSASLGLRLAVLSLVCAVLCVWEYSSDSHLLISERTAFTNALNINILIGGRGALLPSSCCLSNTKSLCVIRSI